MRLHVRTRAGEGPGAPVLAIAGGPGQSAVAFARTWEAMVDAIAPGRALMLLDQRGTGRSGLLRCRALERGRGALSWTAAQCARRLGPRRAHYTTAQSAADIEAVRAALGIDRVALLGVSYGSRVALAYAAAHPERVERIVLDSPVPLHGPDPLMRSTIRSVPRVLRSQCTDRCRARGRRPVRDLARLVSHLRPASSPHRTAVRRADLLQILLAGELDPALRRALPGAVHRARGGDWVPLRRLHRGARRLMRAPVVPRQFSAALHAAVVCEEVELPWPRAAGYTARMRAVGRTIARIPNRTLFPFDRATIRRSEVVRLCARWRHALPAPGPVDVPAAPTLVLAGGRDLITPRPDSRELSEDLPNARLVTDARAGHSVISRRGTRSCTARAVRGFLAGRALPRAERRC